jgi:O-antigen ligase
VALWLGRALPFPLAMVLVPLDRQRRLIMVVICLLLLTTIALTLSAGAFFLGIPAAIFVVILLVYRRRSVLPLLGLAALGGLALPLLAQFPRFARLLEPTDGTNFFRIRVWQSAIAMIRDHPVTGIGQDQFLSLFQGRYIMPDAWQEPSLSHPHNFVFDIWLRLGIAGVVWLLVTCSLLIRSLYHAYARFRLDEGRHLLTALCIGGIGTLANTFTHGLIDNSLFVNDLIYVFVMTCGIAVWCRQHN